MNDVVMMPLWLVIIMAVAAIATIYRHLLAPLVRWFIRVREQRLNEKLTQQLDRKLPEVLNIARKTRVEMLVNKPEVKRAIDEAAHANQGTREVLEYKVREFADELTPGFYALFYFKIGYNMARSYIRMMYDVHITKQPPPSIGDIPESASVVLVGNHRSNVDVMMLAYLAARTNMISFAAGEWAKAWPMSILIRLTGSYMIRRNEKLPIYRKILAIHLRDLVQVKMPQGIFLEGGLTRDGTIQSVKLGLLNYILSASGHENVADIVFVPVAFNYDQVPEDRTLLKHQAQGFEGRSKFYTVFSTLGSLFKMAYQRIRRDRCAFGRAEVSFGEPLYLSRWLRVRGLTAATMSDEQKRSIVAPVAEDLIGVIKAMIPVLPISIVATVFSRSPGEPMNRSEIHSGALRTLQAIRANGSKVSFAESEAEIRFDEAIERLVLRKVLSTDDAGNYSINPDNEALLAYLFNSTKHLLVSDESQPAAGAPRRRA